MRTAGCVGAVLVAGVLTGLPSVATAERAEDARASRHDGNTRPQDCPRLWPGSHGITLTDVDPDLHFVDIVAVPNDVDIVGVVVKGGDAYNKYAAAALGPLPWTDLRAPRNNGGNLPEISHWHACGIETTSTTATRTTTPPTTTTQTTTTRTTVTTAPTTSRTSTGTTTATMGTTTGTTTADITTTSTARTSSTTADGTPTGTPVPDTSRTTPPSTTTTASTVAFVGQAPAGPLALTGARIGVPLALGVLLVLSGGLALLDPRVRAALRRH